jgi:hypothetical protein
MRSIYVRRPLIATSVKESGRFVAQKYFHKLKVLLPSGLSSSTTTTKSDPFSLRISRGPIGNTEAFPISFKKNQKIFPSAVPTGA